MPRFTYSLNGSLSDLVKSDVQFESLAAKVRPDLEGILANYEIQDPATLRRLQNTLLTLDMLQGRNDAARQRIETIRALQEKPAAKLLTGLLSEAILDARKENPAGDEAYKAAVYAHLKKTIDALPWEIVRDDIKLWKGGLEIMSEPVALGVVESQSGDAARRSGGISGDIAEALIATRQTLVLTLPVKDRLLEILGAYIAAHNVQKPDIWEARSVSLTPHDRATPVVVGIWDSGVDTSLFAKQHGSGAESLGIAFDLHSNPSQDLLYPLSADQLRQYAEQKKLLKGFLELQASIDTTDSSEMRQRAALLKPIEVKELTEKLTLFNNYLHGTHVAGIALAGNPFARLTVVRITWDYHAVPELPTDASVRAAVAAYGKAVDYFRQTNTRVVNMSWGTSLKEYERALELNGVGKDAAERHTAARKLFDIDKKGLHDALARVPEILFVAGAGNSATDASFEEFVPASFRMPNLVTVGAVDQAGDQTGFTSSGPTVVVYANGFEVISNVPGGGTLPLSGTSMAAPAVTNLAAKLIALDPSLTPASTIALIVNTADRSGRLSLINPKNAAELLKSRVPR
jgi:subtilisin family serine protease